MNDINKFVAALTAAKKRLFHFTDAQNIESIRAHGLLPTSDLVQRGIVTVTGGDEVSLSI